MHSILQNQQLPLTILSSSIHLPIQNIDRTLLSKCRHMGQKVSFVDINKSLAFIYFWYWLWKMISSNMLQISKWSITQWIRPDVCHECQIHPLLLPPHLILPLLPAHPCCCLVLCAYYVEGCQLLQPLCSISSHFKWWKTQGTILLGWSASVPRKPPVLHPQYGRRSAAPHRTQWC